MDFVCINIVLHTVLLYAFCYNLIFWISAIVLRFIYGNTQGSSELIFSYDIVLLKIIFKIYFMWTIFKVPIELAPTLPSFFFFIYIPLFLGHETCGILAPRLEIELSPIALEGKMPTTGPPGKSLI